MSLAHSFEAFPQTAFPEPDGIVAYFSMEIALNPSMPTYSGGLGVLAGDTLRSAADLGLRLAAVTLLHKKGYFRQTLDGTGTQTEREQPWDFESRLILEEAIAEVAIEGRPVLVRAWRMDLEGAAGHVVPVYLLDTDLEQNDPRDRALSSHLYGGDSNYRLSQEVVLGAGGVGILQAIYEHINVFHMNEGHAALLTVALMEQQLQGDLSRTPQAYDIEAVRNRCVFTTHTPVPAGHDRFDAEQTERILGSRRTSLLEKLGGFSEGVFNMTSIALRMSRFVNGVAMQHGKVSRTMFPDHTIDSITNGVHAGTWTSSAMQAVFDRYIPRWRTDAFQLRSAIDIPSGEIAAAHAAAKGRLFAEVEARTGVALREDRFTLGFARRMATYKRADLLLTNPERLLACAERTGGMQILYGGKAHPHDEPAKQLIRRVFELASGAQSEALTIVYLENYEWELAALLTGGVDLWLNTPQRPYEASGTSGMKAALNGVPSLSILDGWWIEGCIEGFTGWAIADKETPEEEAASLYDRLEQSILPMFYERAEEWQKLMRSTIGLNGSFFNTHRMLQEYIQDAYYPPQDMNISSAALERALQ